MTRKQLTYQWQGMDQSGQQVSGSLTESSLLAVKYQLQRQGIQATRIRRERRTLLSRTGPPIKPMDIAIITRQLATMLAAGVPLVQSLQLMARSASKHTLRTLISRLATEVENGLPLSVVLRQFPLQFGDLYCDLVQSGEQTGSLEQVFAQIAVYREKAEQLKAKVKKALFYPAMVLVVAVLVTALLLLWVIPQFEAMFAGFGAPLPWFTQAVIALSRGVQHYGGYLLIGLVIAAWIYGRTWRRSLRLRQWHDHALLQIPVLGAILRKAALTGFARTLATTFAAGMPLTDGLTLAAGASGNQVYRQAVLQVRDGVIAGMPMHVAVRSTRLFPDMVVQMLMIGEETGVIDDIMYKVANIYEREVDNAVEALASLIEPVMMLVLGILVGGLVIAMYLPIFNLGTVIH